MKSYNCSDCNGKCCYGKIDVYEFDIVFTDSLLVENGYMRVDENSKCVALVHGRCLIYDKRPLVCREFAVDSDCCDKFRNGTQDQLHGCLECPVTKRAKENKDDNVKS